MERQCMGMFGKLVYTARSTYTNSRHIRTMVGLCSATASGPLLAGSHTIGAYVAETCGDRDNSRCLGWNSTTTLIVEELPWFGIAFDRPVFRDRGSRLPHRPSHYFDLGDMIIDPSI